MTAQHTPGPWHIGMKPGPIIYGPKGEQVADLIDDPTISPPVLLTKDENRVNARLIAAAPDLLAQLGAVTERLASWMTAADPDDVTDDDRQALVDARAAIAKAMGEA